MARHAIRIIYHFCLLAFNIFTFVHQHFPIRWKLAPKPLEGVACGLDNGTYRALRVCKTVARSIFEFINFERINYLLYNVGTSCR